MSKQQIESKKFLAEAKPLMVKVGDNTLVAVPKQFSTGSVGYNAAGKVTVAVDGQPVTLQVSMNLTVIGSKPVDAKPAKKSKKNADKPETVEAPADATVAA